MNFRRLAWLPVALIATLLIASPGCRRMKQATDTVVPLTPANRAPPRPTGPIEIGILVPLSGPYEAYGRESLNGMEMARDDLAKAGGLRLQFQVADDVANPEKAKEHFRALAGRHVAAVVGAITSTNALAVAPLADELKLPLLTPSATAFDVTAGRAFVARSCFVDPMQGAAMAMFAREELEAERAVVIVEEGNSYAVGLADAFAGAFGRLEGTVVARWTFPPAATDFASLAARISALPADQAPDAIFFPNYFPEAARFCLAAKAAGLKAPILGGDGWDSSSFYGIAGAASAGHYVCTHFSPDDTEPTVRDFVTRYQAAHGDRPSALAALGYDAIRLLAEALRRAPTLSPEDVQSAISSTRGLSGVTGRITLDECRNPVKNVVILKSGVAGPKFLKRILFELDDIGEDH